ncbi:MAG: hypothetical protein ILP23_00050 [Paludibacteraceae bacterium]|nr:hypothetical protein [Paludibacteraceae bacterium]
MEVNKPRVINLVSLSEDKLQQMLDTAVRVGVMQTLDAVGVNADKPRTKNYLQKKYGRNAVNNAIKDGKLKPRLSLTGRAYYSECDFLMANI